jgi:DNA-directed RNA polymerase specialized sigma24 family protein
MAEQIPLLKSAAEREAFFIGLYKKAFPAVARYVNRMGGTFDQAQDVFQDALVIYYEKVQASSIRVSEKAYLLGIAKHLWSQACKAGSKYQPLDDTDIQAEQGEQPSTHKLMHYLETAGQKCMELLKAYYYDHLPVADIATRFGYTGIRSATVAKYKCLEKVRDKVKQNSLSYADFVE